MFELCGAAIKVGVRVCVAGNKFEPWLSSVSVALGQKSMNALRSKVEGSNYDAEFGILAVRDLQEINTFDSILSLVASATRHADEAGSMRRYCRDGHVVGCCGLLWDVAGCCGMWDVVGCCCYSLLFFVVSFFFSFVLLLGLWRRCWVLSRPWS